MAPETINADGPSATRPICDGASVLGTLPTRSGNRTILSVRLAIDGFVELPPEDACRTVLVRRGAIHTLTARGEIVCLAAGDRRDVPAWMPLRLVSRTGGTAIIAGGVDFSEPPATDW